MKPLSPRTYSQAGFVQNASLVHHKLDGFEIGPYSISSLMVSQLDNLLLHNTQEKENHGAFKESLGIVSRSVIKKTSSSAIQDVLCISSNAKDPRFSRLIDPVIRNLEDDGLKASHDSGKIFQDFLQIKDVFKALTEILKGRRVIMQSWEVITNFDYRLKGFKWFWYNQIFSQLASAHAAERVLVSRRIRFLLVDWDHGANQSLFIGAAKKLGIPNATLVHGNIAVPSKFVPVKADYCYSWGEGQKRFFSIHGLSKNQIREVGFPNFRLPHENDDQDIKKEIPKGPKYWLGFAEQRVRSLNNHQIFKEFQVALDGLGPDWGILIRPHPSQSYSTLVDIFEEDSRMWVVPKNYSSPEVLSQATAFLVVDSTFSLDCIVYGVPLILYNPGKRGQFGLIKELVLKCEAKVVETSQDLVRLIQQGPVAEIEHFTNLSRLQNYLKREVVAVDKAAAKQISKTIQTDLTIRTKT